MTQFSLSSECKIIFWMCWTAYMRNCISVFRPPFSKGSPTLTFFILQQAHKAVICLISDFNISDQFVDLNQVFTIYFSARSTDILCVRWQNMWQTLRKQKPQCKWLLMVAIDWNWHPQEQERSVYSEINMVLYRFQSGNSVTMEA